VVLAPRHPRSRNLNATAPVRSTRAEAARAARALAAGTALRALAIPI
jgi:hypothetical protein